MAKTNNLGELIPIKENNGRRAVNARDLHAFLESKQQFADWIKSRINQYGFVENQDYQILASETYEASWGGNNKVEYALSIDMSKELSMVEKTKKGKEARSYFIDCERVANEKLAIDKQPSVRDKIAVAKFLSSYLNLNDSSKLLIAKSIADPLGLPTPDYTPSKGILKSASELLSERGMKISAQVFNKKAIEKGYLCELERNSAHGQKKRFKSITNKGLYFGENQVNPNNPKSTQPLWYEDKFGELLGVLGFQLTGGMAYEK